MLHVHVEQLAVRRDMCLDLIAWAYKLARACTGFRGLHMFVQVWGIARVCVGLRRLRGLTSCAGLRGFTGCLHV